MFLRNIEGKHYSEEKTKIWPAVLFFQRTRRQDVRQAFSSGRSFCCQKFVTDYTNLAAEGRWAAYKAVLHMVPNGSWHFMTQGHQTRFVYREGFSRYICVYHPHSSSTFLGASIKLRKATIGFVMPVFLSVRTEQLGFHWKDFHKTDI